MKIYKVQYYRNDGKILDLPMLDHSLTKWLYKFDIIERWDCRDFEVIITSLTEMILIYHD
jgi:hypothetical protein